MGQTLAYTCDGRKEKEKKQIERLSAKFEVKVYDTFFPEILAVSHCAVHAASDVPCTQVPALRQVMNKAASMILLCFSAAAAETQQIFIIQSFLLKLGFPRPGWPDKMVPMLSIFFTHQLLLVKGNSSSLL